MHPVLFKRLLVSILNDSERGQSMNQVRTKILVSVATLIAGLLPHAPAHADKPAEIRIAFPGVGAGNRPFVGGHSTAVMHLKGLLDEEFRPDGIKVTWTFLRGAGPAVNELYANGL